MKIHTSGGEIYEARLTLSELESMLGDGFIKIKRNTLVRASEIEAGADKRDPKNGKTATTLNPKDNATRAEIAVMLNRFIESNK